MAGLYIFTCNFWYCCYHIYIVISCCAASFYGWWLYTCATSSYDYLCLRILMCSPLQSTLRTLERSSPCLLCHRSSMKQASFIVHIQNHDEGSVIYVHLIYEICLEICLEPVRYNWSCELYTCENNLVMNNRSVNCVWFVCTVNKLSFEINSCNLVYIYMSFLWDPCIYICDLCISMLFRLCCGL